MKYFPLIWSGLWRRPVRTILTALSIVTAFFLFGMLEGVNAGISMVEEILSVSRLRVTSRVNINDPLPIAHVNRIASVPGVVRVAPVTALVGSYQQPGNVIVVLGTDIEALFDIYPELHMSSEALAAMARTRTGAVVGARLVEQHSWKIGDRIQIRPLNMPRADGAESWEFEIVGIYEHAQPEWSTQVWVNYDYLENGRASGQGTTNQIIAEVEDPEQSAKVSAQIDELFANSPNQTSTQNEKDFLQSVLGQIGDIGFIVNAIVGAVLFALLFLTANTMMQSVRERIPELAVLKTLGFTDTGVLNLVLVEAFLLSLLAALLGLAAAHVVLPAIMRNLPQMNGVHMPPEVFAWGAAVAAVLALASGLPPAIRAQRLSIVNALAGR